MHERGFKASFVSQSSYSFAMASFAISALFIAVLFFSSSASNPPIRGATAASSSYWVASIQRQGSVPFGNAGYQVFRNVKDFGAVGDGNADDADAINNAISSGNRCAKGCDSSTVTPALVYFPPGTYAISKPLVQLYYTQLVGDAVSIPTIKAQAGFQGIGLIDSDPYDNGVNWYTNQNNFFRQVRNFVLDVTAMPNTLGACIHWQVAQATSLQNIVFNMRTDGGNQNRQVGVFMDNGSGGFMTDLTFNGGQYGAFLGNQQFTTRNLTFNNCQTAIFMNWNWAWTLHGITINSAANVGINMSTGGAGTQTVGSVLLVDSTISNTPIGISTVYDKSEIGTNGTLVLDNVDMTNNVPVAVWNAGTTILAGNLKIESWVQGRLYLASNAGYPFQGKQPAATKPSVLLDASSGRVFTRSKPQYESLPVSAFLSVKGNGAKGDGVTDDTAAIQALLNSASVNDVVYFDHGAYLVTDTVKVPKNVRITGEIWAVILAGGSNSFKDQAAPKPVFQVGQPGDTGAVEISDLIFETQGPQPGAIMIEWNVAESTQGSAAMWDVHIRIGGSAGTYLQSDSCSKNPSVTPAAANSVCSGAFLLLHVTKQATLYNEGMWLWVSDHELDLADHNQINIFNGRGALIESVSGPVWMWGTSAEHSVLYNYQISNAENVYMGLIQAETPYFQSNPNAITPFGVNGFYSDPNFSASCGYNYDLCPKAWGLRIINSKNVFVYGAGLYSFFDNYSQDCLQTESCQSNIVDLQGSSNIFLYGLSTKAATNMVTLDGTSAALDSDNRNTFCATVALFKQ